jgi:hypothetical protein
MSNNKYYLSVAAIFKNETMGLSEWIKHYIHHGFDHIYLVNDFSEDNYLEILQPYIDSNYVTLFENDISDKYYGRQVDINNKYFIPIMNQTKWLAIVDLDEFLYSPREIDVKKILRNHEDAAAIYVAWVWFNSNGHISQPKNIVEGFTKRAEYFADVYMKRPGMEPTIVIFAADKIIYNTDYDFYTLDVHTAYTNGQIKTLSYKTNREDPELLLNHYQLQSLEYWDKVKLNRGDVNWLYSGEPRDHEGRNLMDFGNIEDKRLYEQNKDIFI